jgi:prepilin-type N-terminal cleavage/methylation domain-containing protein
MHTPINRKSAKSGFTISELMVAITVFTAVSAGAALTFSMGIRAYRQAAAETDASSRTGVTLSRIAYGVGDSCGLRAAFIPVTTLSSSDGWNITFTVPKGISGGDVQVNHLRYRKAGKIIEFQAGNNPNWTVIGKNIIASSIAASASSVQITIRAQAVTGNKTTSVQKTSTIAFRN